MAIEIIKHNNNDYHFIYLATARTDKWNEIYVGRCSMKRGISLLKTPYFHKSEED